MFLTRSVLNEFVAGPTDAFGLDEDGRLWDIIIMFLYTMERASPEMERLRFELGRRLTADGPEWVEFLAKCGPVDFDDPRPAITIMLSNED